MKAYVFTIFCMSLTLLSSCRLDKTAESSPQVFFPDGSITNLKGDSVKILKRDKVEWNEYYIKDTLYVDSILYFSPRIFGGSGALVEFSVSKSNQNAVELIWSEGIINSNIIIGSSDYSTGLFYLSNVEGVLHFPFRFRALSEDKEFKLDFKVISDASERFKEYNLTLKIPIKEK